MACQTDNHFEGLSSHAATLSPDLPLHLQVGSETLLQDITWRVEPGEKVGLVGTNGSGKSTLLRTLWGSLDVDSGKISVSPGANVGYLEQTAVAGSQRTVYEAR